MRLRELEAELIWKLGSGFCFSTDCPDVAQAQGVLFLCPVCFAKNGGDVGTHSVICWFNGRGVPADTTPGPGRWTAQGTGIDDLTLSPSVDLGPGDCGWHGWVKNGDAS